MSGNDRPPLGYIIGSHVAYQHRALPELLASMMAVGVDPERIVVNVNGSAKRHNCRTDGVTLHFVPGEWTHPFMSLLDHGHGRRGVEHWLFLNSTSQCGSRFKELAEAGFDPEAEVTIAGITFDQDRAINDLAVYRWDFLESRRKMIDNVDRVFRRSVKEYLDTQEGIFFTSAKSRSTYPNAGYELDTNLRDVYGSGVPRATEYFPAIDWYRFKRNFGQMPLERCCVAEM